MTYIPNAVVNQEPRSFVTAKNGQFLLNGQNLRVSGFNFYPPSISSMSQVQLASFFQNLAAKNQTLCRFWAFDGTTPANGYPSNSAGNFQYLDFPLGSNLITNGDFETDTSSWTLQGEFTRSNDTAETGSWSIKQVSNGSFQWFTQTVTLVASTNYVLTFWYKMSHNSGLPPRVIIGTTLGNNDIVDGGYNEDTGGVWVKRQVLFNSGSNTTGYLAFQNFGGNATGYFDTINISVRGTPAIAYREAQYVQLDMIANEALKAGIKLIPSFADNPTYGTKQTYCHFADAIYGTSLEAAGSPYVGFFDNANCRTLLEGHIGNVINRRNTINGRLYKDDDTFFSWELGNEMRYDLFTPEGGTQNTAASTDIIAVSSWIVAMSTYIKSIDPNHMVGYGDLAHTWQWYTGDIVANGSGYGVDWNIQGALTNADGQPSLDYLDFHTYPAQGDGVHLQEYGQHLGFPNSVSGAGYVAQLKEWINAAHALGKPCIIGEVGEDSAPTADNTYYTLYPRYAFAKQFLSDWYDNGGNGVLWWHAADNTTSGSYDIALNATGGEAVTNNTNDTKLVSVLSQRAYQINGQPIPARVVKGINI